MNTDKNHHKKKDSANGQEPVDSKIPQGEQPEASDAKPVNGKVEISAKEYEDLKKKIQELEGLREKFLHAAADFENAKKRNARDKEEFIKFSQERILRELLPVLDNFERAIGHTETASAGAAGEEGLRQNFKTLFSGVQMVQKQLIDILKKHGLKRVETEGQKFDPHFHEIVAHVPEEGPEDHIVDEFEAGYLLYDRLLRAAKVRVRTAPQAQKPAEEKQDEIT